MLREETVCHYVLFAMTAQAFFKNERIETKQVAVMKAQAAKEARRLLSTVPYDEMCANIRAQVLVVHEAKIPAIGKLALTKELAKDDYDRFGDLLAKIDREDFAGLCGEPLDIGSTASK